MLPIRSCPQMPCPVVPSPSCFVVSAMVSEQKRIKQGKTLPLHASLYPMRCNPGCAACRNRSFLSAPYAPLVVFSTDHLSTPAGLFHTVQGWRRREQ
ncbi:unnamed protein product [Mortierella alpina]